ITHLFVTVVSGDFIQISPLALCTNSLASSPAIADCHLRMFSQRVSSDTFTEPAPLGHLTRVKCQGQNGAMKYGYARVSTDDQNPALQLAALKKDGCRTIFKDAGLSGATTKRPALLRCLKKLEHGDTLTVWKLDRLGRSLRDLITMLDDLKKRGVKFRSLTEAIDT